eukprot:2266499-Alexandrium_andersonii.AAC.1
MSHTHTHARTHLSTTQHPPGSLAVLTAARLRRMAREASESPKGTRLRKGGKSFARKCRPHGMFP